MPVKRRAFLVGLAAALVGGSVRAEEMRFLRIGTGRTGGAYFPVGGLIASAISNPPGSRPCEKGGSCGVPGLIAVAQTTGGSVDNLVGLGNRTLDLAICQADVAQDAYRSARTSDGIPALPSLRAVGTLYTESLHLVVREESGITGLGGLKRKRVSLGDPGSGTFASVRLALKAAGLAESDMIVSYEAPGPAADRVADGSLDAFFFFGGEPVTLVTALRERCAVRIAPVESSGFARLLARAPFLTRGEIAAGIYDNPEPVPTLQVGAVLVTTMEMSASLVEGLTAALWHPKIRSLYQRGAPQMRAASPVRAIEGTAIPLHPGAARYYRKAGILDRAGPRQP